MPRQCTEVIFLPEMTLAGRFPVSQCTIPNSRPGETLTGQRAGTYGGGWQTPNHTQTSKKLGQTGRGKGGAPCTHQLWRGAVGALRGGADGHVHIHGTGTGEAPSPARGKPGTPHSLLLRREKEAARRQGEITEIKPSGWVRSEVPAAEQPAYLWRTTSSLLGEGERREKQRTRPGWEGGKEESSGPVPSGSSLPSPAQPRARPEQFKFHQWQRRTQQRAGIHHPFPPNPPPGRASRLQGAPTGLLPAPCTARVG